MYHCRRNARSDFSAILGLRLILLQDFFIQKNYLVLVVNLAIWRTSRAGVTSTGQLSPSVCSVLPDNTYLDGLKWVRNLHFSHCPLPKATMLRKPSICR